MKSFITLLMVSFGFQIKWDIQGSLHHKSWYGFVQFFPGWFQFKLTLSFILFSHNAWDFYSLFKFIRHPTDEWGFEVDIEKVGMCTLILVRVKCFLRWFVRNNLLEFEAKVAELFVFYCDKFDQHMKACSSVVTDDIVYVPILMYPLISIYPLKEQNQSD